MSENKSHVDIGINTYKDELDLRVKHLEAKFKELMKKVLEMKR